MGQDFLKVLDGLHGYILLREIIQEVYKGGGYISKLILSKAA